MARGLRKLGWFIGIWAMSVLALGAVSLAIRHWLGGG